MRSQKTSLEDSISKCTGCGNQNRNRTSSLQPQSEVRTSSLKNNSRCEKFEQFVISQVRECIVLLQVCVFNHSVVSDTLQPCGLYPARLLCPWGFSRQEYWSGFPCPPPGDVPNSGIEPRCPTLQVDSLPSKPLGKLKNTGVGSLSLLQIFPTQELNWDLLHCRQILYYLSHRGDPTKLTLNFQ